MPIRLLMNYFSTLFCTSFIHVPFIVRWRELCVLVLPDWLIHKIQQRDTYVRENRYMYAIKPNGIKENTKLTTLYLNNRY